MCTSVVYMHAQKPKKDTGIFFFYIILCLTALLVILTSLASQQTPRILLSPLPTAGITGTSSYAWFLCVCWNLNSGPHSYMPSTH